MSDINPVVEGVIKGIGHRMDEMQKLLTDATLILVDHPELPGAQEWLLRALTFRITDEARGRQLYNLAAEHMSPEDMAKVRERRART